MPNKEYNPAIQAGIGLSSPQLRGKNLGILAGYGPNVTKPIKDKSYSGAATSDQDN